MPIQITIEDNEVSVLTEFYASRLKVVRDKKVELDREEKSLEDKIKQLHRQPVTSAIQVSPQLTLNEMNGYNSNTTNIAKIEYVLREAGKPLTTRQIIDRLLILDPALNANKLKVAKNISTVLSINQGDDKRFTRGKTEDDKEYTFELNILY